MQNNLIDPNAKMLFEKRSPSNNKSYRVLKNHYLGNWFIDPIPTKKELNDLYQDQYFKRRTDRGYDSYASSKIRHVVHQTLDKNFVDLKFEKWQKNLATKKALEIGCASGHFLAYLEKKGWSITGIDIASEMVLLAKNEGLTAHNVDFMSHQFEGKTMLSKTSLDLIVMWATLEHLIDPIALIKKAQEYLKPGGKFIFSTCHLGYFAKRKKQNWRYLNVPEHIWYFSLKSLKAIFEPYGFKLNHSFTYGSGYTTQANMSWTFTQQKKMADKAAKCFHLGDMIVCEFVKV